MSAADAAAKAAANRAADALHGRSVADAPLADRSLGSKLNPRLVFPPFLAQAERTNDTDTTGAIGTRRFIQIGGKRVGISAAPTAR